MSKNLKENENRLVGIIEYTTQEEVSIEAHMYDGKMVYTVLVGDTFNAQSADEKEAIKLARKVIAKHKKPKTVIWKRDLVHGTTKKRVN